jgi:hypothetical protein
VRTAIAQKLKEKIGKWDCIKLKSFWKAEKIITGLKRQPIQ